MEILRTEIIEAQKARADLFKWKIVIVAVLASVGLGLGSSHNAYPLVLIGIPPVCIYVDLLLRHLNLRIQVIAAFIRQAEPSPVGSDGMIQAYERFVPTKAKDAFVLETWAMYYSTIAFALGDCVYGTWMASNGYPLGVGSSLIGSGLLGVVLAWISNNRYQAAFKTIRPPEIGEKQGLK